MHKIKSAVVLAEYNALYRVSIILCDRYEQHTHRYVVWDYDSSSDSTYNGSYHTDPDEARKSFAARVEAAISILPINI